PSSLFSSCFPSFPSFLLSSPSSSPRHTSRSPFHPSSFLQFSSHQASRPLFYPSSLFHSSSLLHSLFFFILVSPSSFFSRLILSSSRFPFSSLSLLSSPSFFFSSRFPVFSFIPHFLSFIPSLLSFIPSLLSFIPLLHSFSSLLHLFSPLYLSSLPLSLFI